MCVCMLEPVTSGSPKSIQMAHSSTSTLSFLGCTFPYALKTDSLICNFKDRIKSCMYLHFYLLLLLIPPESTYRHQATIDDEVVTMEILDTAGQVNKEFCSNILWIK